MHDDDMAVPEAATPMWRGLEEFDEAEWPGQIDTEGIDADTSLRPVQDARVSALHQARIVLERHGGIGNVHVPPNRMDLLAVATWIMTGSAHVQ